MFVPIEEGLVVTTSIKEVDDNKPQSEYTGEFYVGLHLPPLGKSVGDYKMC